MLTKKVKKRFSFLSLFLIISIFSVFFILKSLNNNILYFKSPSEIKSAQDLVFDEKIRVGGMVKKSSIEVEKKSNLRFSDSSDIMLASRDLFCRILEKG